MTRVFLTLSVLILLAGCGGGITGERIADYDSLIESGWENYNQNRYDEAYQLFLLARKEDDERPEAFLGSGWSLLRRQHPDSAAVVFKTGFEYIASLSDTVDALCGLSGSYLADGDNMKVIDSFKKYTVESYEDVFPLKEHDFFLDETDLEIVQAMACYRLGLYSSTEKADPDNAVYHLNQVLITPIEYTDPKTLMQELMDFVESTGGDYSL